MPYVSTRGRSLTPEAQSPGALPQNIPSTEYKDTSRKKSHGTPEQMAQGPSPIFSEAQTRAASSYCWTPTAGFTPCSTCGVTILLVSFMAAIASSYRPATEFPRMTAISSSIFMPSFR